MHPLLKAALRALLVLGAIGIATVAVVNRGGGTDPAGSAARRSTPRTRPATTSTTVPVPPAEVDGATAAVGDFTGSGSFDGGGDGTGATGPDAALAPAEVPATVGTTAPTTVPGPPPTVAESGTPWLLPVTGALTVAGVAGLVVWRSRRGRP